MMENLLSKKKRKKNEGPTNIVQEMMAYYDNRPNPPTVNDGSTYKIKNSLALKAVATWAQPVSAQKSKLVKNSDKGILNPIKSIDNKLRPTLIRSNSLDTLKIDIVGDTLFQDDMTIIGQIAMANYLPTQFQQSIILVDTICPTSRKSLSNHHTTLNDEDQYFGNPFYSTFPPISLPSKDGKQKLSNEYTNFLYYDFKASSSIPCTSLMLEMGLQEMLALLQEEIEQRQVKIML